MIFPIKKNITIVSVLTITLLSVPAMSIPATSLNVDTDTLFTSLVACSKITNDQKRLHCFDALITQEKPAYDNIDVDDFKALLTANNLEVGESRAMFYQLFNALDGISLDVNDQAIEVYVFDFNTDTGRKAFNHWSNEGIVGHYPLKFKNLLIKVPGTHPKKRKISLILSNTS